MHFARSFRILHTFRQCVVIAGAVVVVVVVGGFFSVLETLALIHFVNAVCRSTSVKYALKSLKINRHFHERTNIYKIMLYVAH